MESAGSDAVRYVELTDRDASQRGDAKFQLVKADFITGKTTTLLDDSGEYPIMTHDHVVFVRTAKRNNQISQQLFAASLNRDELIAISPATGTIHGVAVDELNDIVYFGWQRNPIAGGNSVPEDGIYKIPISGGKMERAGVGRSVHGWFAERSAVLVSSGRYLALQPNNGGDAMPLNIKIDKWHGIVGTRLIYSSDDGTTRSMTPFAASNEPSGVPDVAAPEKSLELEARYVTGTGFDNIEFLFGETKHGFVVFYTDGVTARRLMFTNAKVSGLVRLGQKFAGLVVHDTDNDGAYTSIDEADVCLFERVQADVPIRIPTRTVPARFVELATKLRTVSDAVHLGDVTTRIWETSPSGPLNVTFVALGEGPRDLAELHKFARQLQRNALLVSGERVLEIGVRFQDNGYNAYNVWDETTRTFRTSAGIGFARLHDPAEWPLAVDSVVTTTISSDPVIPSHIGPAICDGSITNTSANLMEDLTLACTGDDAAGLPQVTTTVIKRLHPGATTPFSIRVASVDGARSIKLTISHGSASIAFLNRVKQAQLADDLTLARAILEQTKFVFLRSDIAPNSIDRSSFRLVVLHEPADFATRSEAERQKTAKKIAEMIAEHYSRHKDGGPLPIGMRVLEHTSWKVAWMFWDGQIVPTQ